jgi:hypothetical protein
MTIDLSEVGAAAVKDGAGHWQVHIGIYLPGITFPDSARPISFTAPTRQSARYPRFDAGNGRSLVIQCEHLPEPGESGAPPTRKPAYVIAPYTAKGVPRPQN